jgi:ubiquitin-conjugating enzyme E2 G1
MIDRSCALLLLGGVIELAKNPVDGFSVGLADDSNIYEWQCMMEGPADTD